jgi:TonB-linked SusC/RagA family outer membrane protein
LRHLKQIIFQKKIYRMRKNLKLFKNQLMPDSLFKKSWKVITLFICSILFATSAFSQDRTVSGTIKDNTGNPLPGAIVKVKGTTLATATDINGAYSLSVPESMKDSSISITSIGYAPVEIKMAGQTSFSPVLVASAKSLNEVIVVGYGTQKKSDLTGAISSVSAADIEKAPVLEVAQAIQGRMAGVQVLPSSGSPGADVNIRVRGTATVGNSNPLYVVDGVPMAEFALSAVNPIDIESIDVLKDASACAIYGSRGANGVVLVTTKKGKAGKTVIQFDAYTGTQSAWKKLNLLHADQWAMLNNEAALADGKDLNPKFVNPSALGTGTDWQDQIFRVAPINSYNLSAGGGSEKNTFYVSGNYFKQDGIIKKTDAERMSFRLNASQQMTSKFKTGQFLNVMRFKKNTITEDNEFTSVLNAALTMDPTIPVTNPDNTFAASPNNNINNPAALLANSNNTFTNNRVIGTFFGEYEFIEGLKFKSLVGIDGSFGNYNGFAPSFYVSPSFQSSTNTVTRYSEQRLTSVWDNTITYTKKVKENHEFSVLAGISAQSSASESITASKSGVQSNDPNLRYLDAATVNPSASGSAGSSGLYSYLGRVNYVFKNKYLLTANLRVDGSSRFIGNNNRWGYFPSVSVGWKLNEEEFMKKFPVVSTLKLRVGVGQLGNQSLYGVNGLYPYTTVVSPGQNYTFGADKTLNAGSTQLSVGNPLVKWETVTQTNFGIDGGLFDEKVSFVIDYYIKKTTGMLVQTPVPTYLGLQNPPFTNAGEVLNRGLELGIQYKKLEGQFHYNAGFNISFVHNEVVSLGNGDAISSADFAHLGNVSRTEVGQPIASFYGYKTNGIFQNAAEVNASAQKTAKPGDIRFMDLNGDGKIDEKDRTFIGSPMPDFTYGINLGATYKGFDFSIFFQGVQGNKLFNGNKYNLESGVAYTNMSNSMLNRWTGEGSSNDLPRMTQADLNNNRRISDRYIEDGSYLRIKTMQLGYTLPIGVIKYARIEKVRIYFAAQNLLTWTKYKGLDPEVGILGGTSGNVLDIGIDRGAYPQARTFTIGANLTF